MEAWVPFLLLFLALIAAAPIVAIVSLVRVNRLRREVNELQALIRDRGTAAAAPATAPAAAAPAPTVAPVAAPEAPPASPPRPRVVEPAPAPAPTVVPRAEAAPPLPNLFQTTPAPRPAVDWETIIAGRWLNRVGLLAVAIGVSYFLKYAIDNDWIGPHGQVALGAIMGAGLVVWSQAFTRRGWHFFADGVAGLGAAILYLSLWAGTSYYDILSTTTGFLAMIVVTAAMGVIAFGRNRAAIAALTLIGGFLTPILVSTGQDAQVVLFSYLALHNTALIVLAHRRDWRFLELPAFLFTQVYFWGWYGQFYAPDVLWRTLAFATLFFVQFSALCVIRIRRSGSVRPEHMVLLPLDTGALLLAGAAMLYDEHRWLLTGLALALAVYHLAVARLIPADSPTESLARRLTAGLALTLTTAAIGIRLEDHWITLAWAVQAGVLAWSGFASNVKLPRGFAYALFALVAYRLLQDPMGATTFLFNARLSTTLIVALSAAVAVRAARQHQAALFEMEDKLVAALAVAANVLVLWALTREVDLYFARPDQFLASYDVGLARSLTVSILWTLYATALVVVGVQVKSAPIRWQGLVLFGITTLKVFFADLAYLSGAYRIASSIALGLVLLAVSFLYQRSLVARRADQENQP